MEEAGAGREVVEATRPERPVLLPRRRAWWLILFTSIPLAFWTVGALHRRVWWEAVLIGALFLYSTVVPLLRHRWTGESVETCLGPLVVQRHAIRPVALGTWGSSFRPTAYGPVFLLADAGATAASTAPAGSRRWMRAARRSGAIVTPLAVTPDPVGWARVLGVPLRVLGQSVPGPAADQARADQNSS